MFPSALTTSSGGGLGTVGTMRFREVDQKGLGEWKGISLTWARLLEGLHADHMNLFPQLVHKAPIAFCYM